MQNNPVVIADADGIIRFWSAGAEKSFGHSAAQSIGRTLDLIVPPPYREAHWTGFRRAIASGQAGVEGLVIPFPVLTADGCIVECPGRLTLLRQASGEVVAAMVVFG